MKPNFKYPALIEHIAKSLDAITAADNEILRIQRNNEVGTTTERDSLLSGRDLLSRSSAYLGTLKQDIERYVARRNEGE